MLLRVEAELVVPPLNGSLIGTPLKVSENWPLLKARKVMLVRTLFAAGVRTLIEGVRSSRLCTLSMGEEKRMAEGPMTEALKAELIGMRVRVSSRAITWIVESCLTGFPFTCCVVLTGVGAPCVLPVCAAAPSGESAIHPAPASAVKSRVDWSLRMITSSR